MVMITRSTYRKACESSNCSDLSQQNIIPPWCSSGKVYDGRKSRKLASDWEIRSTYPYRQNIWEYLYEDNANFNCCGKRRKRKPCKPAPGKNSRWKTKSLVVLVALFGVIVSLWMTQTFPGTDLLNKVIPNYDLISLTVYPANMRTSTSVGYECCQRLKYLTEELSRAEQILRNSLRRRRSKMLTSQSTRTGTNHIKETDTRRIEGATAVKGAETMTWGGRVALWGIVPLWRAAPPPGIILATRRATLADCWPFVGSYGEIIIQLPRTQAVRYVSLEHIKPDTARSAPKHFQFYGVLPNNTWAKMVSGLYRDDGPAKQYYSLAHKDAPLKSLIFQVLTNQGNEKYTCIYRVHLYGKLGSGVI